MQGYYPAVRRAECLTYLSLLISSLLAATELHAVSPPADESPASAELLAGDRTTRYTPGGGVFSPEVRDQGAGGWTPVLFEDGEGNFPQGNGWFVADFDLFSGEDFWGTVGCRSFSGSRSVWCAGVGSQPFCGSYDDDMRSWMIFGPFSLADAQDARAEFQLWSETERPDLPFDSIFWGASINGQNYWGTRLNTNTSWSERVFDFKDVPELGNLLGEPEVWFAFFFDSDTSVSNFEGTYLDDILIEKRVASPEPDIHIEPLTLTFNRGSNRESADPLASTVTEDAPLHAAMRVFDRQVEALTVKAEQQGSVRVLVGLDAGFQPEGRLSQAVAESQRRTTARLQARVLDELAGLDVRLHARYRYIPFLALTVDATALASLIALPEVVTLEEDRLSRPTMASSNPVIGSPAAWAAGYDGAGQTVAVLDTGVDSSHPFFTTGGNKVVSEACYSTTASEVEATSFCPGGAQSSTAPGSGRNCPDSIDGCDHGTHVAGTTVGNDGSGPDFGVARGADLIPIQVFSRFDDFEICGGYPPCTLAFTSDQIEGLERVYELRNTFNIAAANMSLGGGQYFDTASCDADNVARKAAIDNLRSVGIATVIASGNSGFFTSMGAPGCISTAISVGATDDDDAVASFSNIASFLDLVAPGVAIDSSVPGGIGSKDGTSMATPHVAGAWALLKQAAPTLSVDDALAALRATATSVDDNRSGGTVRDLRRINVDRAVNAVATGPSRTFTIYNQGSVTLTVTSIALDAAASWISWSPAAPFNISPGGSRQVTVTVDFAGAPEGETTRRLLVESNDDDASPYPGGVFLIVNVPLCEDLDGDEICDDVDDCVAGPLTGCLLGDRFRVEGTMKNFDSPPRTFDARVMTFSGGRAESDQAAFFESFNRGNFEIGVKMVDACSLPDDHPLHAFWVFFGGLTNARTEIQVMDTVTQEIYEWTNPSDVFPVTLGDTNAFPCTPGGQEVPCERDGNTACLLDGRFRVTGSMWNFDTPPRQFPVSVMNFPAGRAESSQAVFFESFNPGNFEIGVKMVDACSLPDDHPLRAYWVFYGGLTNAETRVRVTQLSTGFVDEWFNPSELFPQSQGRIDAFACE